eukprot:jgi/Undpi1/3416/HiC_scaffold_16.g06789.m1
MVVGCQPLTGESMRWIKDTVSGLSNPHDAAARNRVSKMQKYIQQGGDVNKGNKLGDTPMHEACAYIRDSGDSSKGKKRKAVGKDRRKVGKKLSQRGLGLGGPLEMLELLLSAGANINAQNIVGDAPLHKAALNGRALSTDYLLRSGANVNIRNEFAQTPLHAACVSGNIEVVQRLVQGGADTNAQDAAEDTPYHEACRHQYEGIAMYLSRLVNNPDTNLLRGLDPSWEKMLRSREQAPTPEGDGRGHNPAMVPAVTGPSSSGLGLNTPSTTHNSLQSSESAGGGVGLSGRTPGGRQFSGGGGGGGGSAGGGKGTSANGGLAVSVQSCHTESMSPPRGNATRTHQVRPFSYNAGGSRPNSMSKPKRGRQEKRREPGVEQTIPRTFSTGAAEVLAWQATKAKNPQQGRLIEKAREALREEQHEAAMAMSVTTQGDDDGSVDTFNTGDTPTAYDGRLAQRKDSSVVSDLDADLTPRSFATTPANANSNANGIAAGSGGGRRMRDNRATDEAVAAVVAATMAVATSTAVAAQAQAAAAAAAAATAQAAPAAGGGETKAPGGSGEVSPVAPTPPSADLKGVEMHAPWRDSIRRVAARKSKGATMALRSPRARVSRRSASGKGLSVEVADGSAIGSSEQRSARRERSDRDRGERSERRDRERGERGAGPGGVFTRSRQGRRAEGKGAGGRGGETVIVIAVVATVGVGLRRDRPLRGRSRNATTGRGGNRRGLPREGTALGEHIGRTRVGGSRGGGTSRGLLEEEEEEEGAQARRGGEGGGSGSSRGGGGGGGSSRGGGAGSEQYSGSKSRRDSQRLYRSSGAEGAEAGAAALAAAVAAAAAVSATDERRQVPAIVEEAVKAPHAMRTPRQRDGMSAHFMAHETSSVKSRGGEQVAERARKYSGGSAGSGGGGRPLLLAPKRRSNPPHDLRPPSWASDVSTGLEDSIPSRATRIVESKLPVKRPSPYNVTKYASYEAGGGGVARVNSTGKFFFTRSPRPSSPCTSAAGSAYASTHSRAEREGALLAQAAAASAGGAGGNNGCRLSSTAEGGMAARGRGGSNDHPRSSSALMAGATAAASSAKFKTVPATRGAQVDLARGAKKPGAGEKAVAEAISGARVGVGANSAAAAGVREKSTAKAFGFPASPASLRNSAKGSVTSTEEDFPPSIEALQMVQSASGSGGGKDGAAARVVVVTAAAAAAAKASSAAAAAATKASSAATAAAVVATMVTSESLLFSDSDTDNDRSSGNTSRASSTFGGSQAASVLSAIGASNLLRDSEIPPSDEDVDMAIESADGATSVVTISAGPNGNGKARTGGGGGVRGAPDSQGAARVLRPPPKRAVSKVDGQMSVVAPVAATVVPPTSPPAYTPIVAAPPAPAVVGVAVAVPPQVVGVAVSPRPALVPGAKAPAVAEDGDEPPAAGVAAAVAAVAAVVAAVGHKLGTVEPSSAPRPPVRVSPQKLRAPEALKVPEAPKPPEAVEAEASGAAVLLASAAAPVAAPVRASGSALMSAPVSASTSRVASPTAAGGRSRSALGRRGTAPTKANGEGDAAAVLAAAAAAVASGVQGLEGEDDVNGEQADAETEPETAVNIAARTAANAKGPRGFKNPVGLEGANKGPAGAFSGNSMWRLAGGASAAAGRAKSGVAANGHGGYSNPLAAMRAGGSGQGHDPAAARGGAVANPLAGFRGGVGMGGAGVVNPLARGRSARPAAGGMTNPMLGLGGAGLRGGGGGRTANPLARGLNGAGGGGGGGLLSPTSGVANAFKAQLSPPRSPRVIGDRGGDDGDEDASRPRPTSLPLYSPPLQRPASSSPVASSAPPSPAAERAGWGVAAAAAVEAKRAVDDAASGAAGGGGDVDVVEAESRAAGAGDELRGGGVPRGFGRIPGGTNGTRPKSGLPRPPRRQARALQQIGNDVDRDPGQAMVSGVVMALQKPNDARSALMIDPQHTEVSDVAEQGLVQLRRVKYSPRPTARETGTA